MIVILHRSWSGPDDELTNQAKWLELIGDDDDGDDDIQISLTGIDGIGKDAPWITVRGAELYEAIKALRKAGKACR